MMNGETAFRTFIIGQWKRDTILMLHEENVLLTESIITAIIPLQIVVGSIALFKQVIAGYQNRRKQVHFDV